MKKHFDWVGVIVLTIAGTLIGLVIGIIWGILSGFNTGYKGGQEDALNGKWKYEYTVKTDTVFVKIDQ